MHIEDFRASIEVFSEEALLDRLKTVRRGHLGAFILSHNNRSPTLFVHLNGHVAYLHYFVSEEGHPGFQPRNMSPDKCPECVDFLQVNGEEADSITMPRDTLISDNAAYSAAIEFFRSSDLPKSVSWVEL